MTPHESRMIAHDMGALYADPLSFVHYAFSWGEGELEAWDGPDEWQTEFLTELGAAVKSREPGDVVRMAVKTGRGPGKTAVIAWLILWLMSTRPNFAGLVTANTGDQLDSKTFRELALWHRRAIHKDWFVWTATRFYHVEAKETWGIDAIKWGANRPDAFGGLHNNGRGQCAILDEGSGIANEIYDVVDATMTDPDSFVFVFANPIRKTGRFYEIFTRFRHRWRTMTVDTRRAKAANPKQIQDMIDDWGLDSDHVRVNVLGEFPNVDSDTLIPMHLLDAAAKREILDDAVKAVKPVWGLDPARFGDDRTALAKRRGRKLLEPVKAWRGLDTMQTVGRIAAMLEDVPADELPGHIVVDVIGIGAGVVDRLRELELPGRPQIVALNVSESPSVAGKHAKLRDEIAWKARQWFEGLDVSMQDPALAAEAADLLYGYTSNGMLKIESKDDTKKRLGRSPDLWDAFVGTFAVAPMQVERPVDRYERARWRASNSGSSAWAS